MTTIEVRETPPGMIDEGWDPETLTVHDLDTPRASALFAALGVPFGDEGYALCRHPDGRWALIGLKTTDARCAVEVAHA